MNTFFSLLRALKNKHLKNDSRRIIYLVSKRMLDIVISIIVMPFVLIVITLFGILIKLETPGPVIYSQKRTGKDGKLFTIYKLRSMYINSEENGPQWAQKSDPRVTKVGRFIRKARIDETPQIVNLLKGDMSIVGPRPERPYFVYKFSKDNPSFTERLKVKPGLTGWAQVNGGYELTPDEKLEKDLFYINHQSFWLDLKIIFKTIKIVLGRVDAR